MNSPAADVSDAPTPTYGEWKAPAEDGELLVWPGPPTLLDDVAENGRRLRAADSVRIQNVSLPEIRRRLRAFIGQADEQVPLIATGHQAELHHPGVWVKNALIDAIANRVGGQAYHFAVDTDAPKHLALRWPGGSELLSDDPDAASHKWSGLVAPPTPAHLSHLASAFESAGAAWDFKPEVPQVLTSMRRLALEATDLPSMLTNALHELDWSLGLRHHAMIVSPLWQSEPYLLFAHHVMACAGDFAADYNAALAAYRKRNKIRTPGRPMPDLQLSDESCEVPFWLDDLATGGRSRASVFRCIDGTAWEMRGADSDADPFRLDPATDGWAAVDALRLWLHRRQLRLSPRALTLTTVLRLLAADQFVHGIGGGQYDQVADALIARHLKFAAPRFAVTTATMYFPQAAGVERVCVPCVRREGHRLKHGILGDEKQRLVRAIAAAPRNSQARRSLYNDMHGRLTAAAVTHPSIAAWEQKLRETGERELEERVLFDRELFYAIQPRERLAEMIGQYRRVVS